MTRPQRAPPLRCLEEALCLDPSSRRWEDSTQHLGVGLETLDRPGSGPSPPSLQLLQGEVLVAIAAVAIPELDRRAVGRGALVQVDAPAAAGVHHLEITD